MTITQRPYKFSFSKNPLQYNFGSISNYADAGCYVMIQIWVRSIGGGDDALLFEEKIKPLTSSLNYDMRTIAESALAYTMPDFSGSTIQAGTNAKEFYVKYCTITDAAPTPSYTSDAVNFLYVVKGGIPQPMWDWNNYFIAYVPNKKPFLTWQPDNRFVGLNQDFFISFLNSQTTVSLALIVDVVYTDGTTDQVITNFSDSDKILYHIAAGPDQLGLNALHSTLKLYKYSISVVSAASHDTIYAGPVTYYVDYRQFYNTKYLHYFNSLGGVEAIRVNGQIETIADVSFTDSEVYGGDIIVGTPHTEEYTQTAKSKIDSFKGDTGYFYTSREQDALQEILLTRFAWERIIGQNWRIYVMNKTTSLRKSTDKRWSIPLEWRYSFSNSVYAPIIDLGASCVPVSVSGTLPDGLTGIAYSATITLSGTSPFTLSSIVKPSWMTVTVSGSTVSCTGTPADGDEGTGITVSFTASNACGSAAFSDTIDITLSGTRFTTATDNGGDSLNHYETANIIGGAPGATVTVTLDTLTNSNGGVLQVNGVDATEGNTYDIVLDSLGRGHFDADILGVDNPGTGILGHFTITAVSAGTISSPDTYSTSKAF